jgi:DNA end-binding protein Ku
MTGTWEPRKYHDTYREDLMKRIKEKVKNKETHTLTEASKEAKPRKSAEIIDLMAVLKQSLEKGKGTGHAARTARHAKRKSARG